MLFVLFYYTLLLLLVTILASALCLSVYVVSRRRTMLFACLVFLFYFFDIALVFQNDFLATSDLSPDALYVLVVSLAAIVTGLGFIGSFWLLVCDYCEEKRRWIIIGLPALFVVTSLIAFFFPKGDFRSFLLYTPRELFLFEILVYLALYYRTLKNPLKKDQLKSYWGFYTFFWVMGALVLLEDACYFLIFDSAQIEFGPRSLSIDRNFSENILMLFCVFFSCRKALSLLSLRFNHPQEYADNQAQKEGFNRDEIALYGERYNLSRRECDVLAFVMAGKDNQNIASLMNLSPSTIKVHVHSILQKTGQPNRKSLIQDFWKTY